MDCKNINLPIISKENQINTSLYSQQNNLEVSSLIHPQYQPTHFSENCINNVVRTRNPLERMHWNDYVMVRCSNVTTAWINLYGFSYLSSYSNEENYFFIPLADDGFNLNNWTENSTKNKITREKLNEFISQFNSQFDIINLIKTVKIYAYMKRVIFSILATIFLISLIVCLIMTIKTWEKRRKVIYFPLCFINAILLLIPMIFYYRNCLYISYQVDTALLNNTSGVENFLKNWNMQYFLPNNIYVIVPRNLR